MAKYAPLRYPHALFDTRIALFLRERVGGEGRRKASEELQGEA